MTSRSTQDGINRQVLTEGILRKGGSNTTTQIQTRPPAPAPMRPASTSTSGGNTGSSSIKSSS